MDAGYFVAKLANLLMLSLPTIIPSERRTIRKLTDIAGCDVWPEPTPSSAVMCTVVLLIRPGHAWPLVLAANRDEMLDRAWDPPAGHWPDRPGIIAGRDRSGGGTWMGVNRDGVVAAVLNRPGSLGPAAGKRSRGELPLLALAHPIRRRGRRGHCRPRCRRLAQLQPGAGRSSRRDLRPRPRPRPSGGPASGPGLHMVTAHDPDDPESPRVARHLARFQAAERPADSGPDPGLAILAGYSGRPERGRRRADQRRAACRASARSVPHCWRFLRPARPVWLFAAGPPDEAPFSLVR